MSISEELCQNRLVFSGLTGSGKEETPIPPISWRETPVSITGQINTDSSTPSWPVVSPPVQTNSGDLSRSLPSVLTEAVTWESNVPDMDITVTDIRYPEISGGDTVSPPDAAETLFSRLEREERLRPQRTEV